MFRRSFSDAEAKELSKSSLSWHPFITLSIIVTELRIVYYSYRTPAGNQLLFRRLFWGSSVQALNIWISLYNIMRLRVLSFIGYCNQFSVHEVEGIRGREAIYKAERRD